MNFDESWFFLMEHKIFNYSVTTSLPTCEQFKEMISKSSIEKGEITTRRSRFPCDLDIIVLKYNPRTGEMELDECNAHLNTAVSIHLECGEVVLNDANGVVMSHDYELDVSADTFEAAVIKLGELVKRKHGDDCVASSIYLSKALK